MAHHKVEHEKHGKKEHNESKAGKLKIHGGFKSMEHEKHEGKHHPRKK